MVAFLLSVLDMVSVPRLSKSVALLQMTSYYPKNILQLAQETHLELSRTEVIKLFVLLVLKMRRLQIVCETPSKYFKVLKNNNSNTYQFLFN